MRPWSTVLCVPTDEGDLWFKANMPAQSYEAAVIRMLAGRAPDRVPRLLAADFQRGWILQPDGGKRLRELLPDDPDLRRWEEVLACYAELQIAAAPARDGLLAAGAPDRRLHVLPAQFDELAAGAERFGLLDEEAQRVRALVPRLRRRCDELAGLDLPETVQHDDFHDAQVFVRDGNCVFFDWGDSCVSHPFFTLAVTLDVIAHRLGVGLADPEVERCRDAYLEPWGRLRPAKELRAAVPTARWLGSACRALTWNMIVEALPSPHREDHADVVPHRLRSLLEPMPA